MCPIIILNNIDNNMDISLLNLITVEPLLSDNLGGRGKGEWALSRADSLREVGT